MAQEAETLTGASAVFSPGSPSGLYCADFPGFGCFALDAVVEGAAVSIVLTNAAGTAAAPGVETVAVEAAIALEVPR